MDNQTNFKNMQELTPGLCDPCAMEFKIVTKVDTGAGNGAMGDNCLEDF